MFLSVQFSYTRHVIAAENRLTIAAAGAIGPLVTLLGSPSEGVQEASAAALGNLAAKCGSDHGVVVYNCPVLNCAASL